jgi:hypothetical protein
LCLTLLYFPAQKIQYQSYFQPFSPINGTNLKLSITIFSNDDIFYIKYNIDNPSDDEKTEINKEFYYIVFNHQRALKLKRME